MDQSNGRGNHYTRVESNLRTRAKTNRGETNFLKMGVHDQDWP